MPVLVLELVPLGIASALIPLPIIVTVLLLRSPSGKAAATGWLGGQVVARLLQGLLIALLLDRAYGASDDAKKGPVLSAVLLVLGILFYVLAARKALDAPDEDAPPPSWMTALETATPGKAFLFGAALMAISVKFWVFTLGATAGISYAGLETAPAIVIYLAWIVLACSVQLALVLATVVAPARADVLLARVGDLLARYSRPLLIVVGLLFGSIFLSEGLVGLGVL